jgi:hypothetical protein
MLCLFVKRGGKVAKELTLKQEINLLCIFREDECILGSSAVKMGVESQL